MQIITITVCNLLSMRSRTLYVGFIDFIWAIAGGAGPVVGGALTKILRWRWCLWVRLPVCAVPWILLLLCLDVHKPKASWRDGLLAIDWFGTVSVLAVTLMLVLGLDFGGAIFPLEQSESHQPHHLGCVDDGFFSLRREKASQISADTIECISRAIKCRCLRRRNNARHCFYGSGILSASFLPKC